jgi:hypothetical protein
MQDAMQADTQSRQSVTRPQHPFLSQMQLQSILSLTHNTLVESQYNLQTPCHQKAGNTGVMPACPATIEVVCSAETCTTPFPYVSVYMHNSTRPSLWPQHPCFHNSVREEPS